MTETYTSDELYEYCMKEYNNPNPIAKLMFENFYTHLKKVIEQFVRPEYKLLEIGCGAGESSRRIKKMISERTEFKISEYDMRYVEMLNKNEPELNVFQENVYNINQENNSFEVLFLLEVLEHLEEYNKALSELFRVSSKYVIISVPREPIWRILNLLRLKYVTDLGNTPTHINHWSTKQFVKLLSNYGQVRCIETPLPWTILLVEKNKF